MARRDGRRAAGRLARVGLVGKPAFAWMASLGGAGGARLLRRVDNGARAGTLREMARACTTWIRWSAVAALPLLPVSCAKDKGMERPPESGQVLALSESAGAAALDKKFAMQKGDVTYGEDGSIKGGQRSQFEGRRSVAFGGDWGDKSYGKKQYGKAAWGGGDREMAGKSFDKGRDGQFRFASLFGGKKSAQAGQRSAYDGKNRVKETVRTGAAREASGSSLAKPADAKAAWRRSVYPQPRIESLADAQRKNVEETRSLLGRDD